MSFIYLLLYFYLNFCILPLHFYLLLLAIVDLYVLLFILWFVYLIYYLCACTISLFKLFINVTILLFLVLLSSSFLLLFICACLTQLVTLFAQLIPFFLYLLHILLFWFVCLILFFFNCFCLVPYLSTLFVNVCGLILSHQLVQLLVILFMF